MTRYTKSKKSKIEQVKILQQLAGDLPMKDEAVRKKVFTDKMIDNMVQKQQQSLPPNPQANMAYALGKCYQCGSQFSDEDIQLNAVYHRPNAIVFCNDCFKLFTAHANGTIPGSTPLSIPFAHTPQCTEEYQALVLVSLL